MKNALFVAVVLVAVFTAVAMTTSGCSSKTLATSPVVAAQPETTSVEVTPTPPASRVLFNAFKPDEWEVIVDTTSTSGSFGWAPGRCGGSFPEYVYNFSDTTGQRYDMRIVSKRSYDLSNHAALSIGYRIMCLPDTGNNVASHTRCTITVIDGNDYRHFFCPELIYGQGYQYTVHTENLRLPTDKKARANCRFEIWMYTTIRSARNYAEPPPGSFQRGRACVGEWFVE